LTLGKYRLTFRFEEFDKAACLSIIPNKTATIADIPGPAISGLGPQGGEN
jgi:hypothetical protein